MSAIIEPTGATWHVSPTMWKSVSVVANSEDRNVILRRDYPRVPGEKPLVESIELHLSDLPAIEAALLNARLWLERATKQADELKAAEETAQDEPQPLVCVRCDHPWHQGVACDTCGCDDRARCWHCNHPLMIHGRDGCRWSYVSTAYECGCTVSNLTTAEQIREQP